MDKLEALDALSALGQATRIDIFRALVQAGDEGLPAGAIGERLEVRQNTLSANLSILHRAGLVSRRREGRSIRYAADMGGMAALLAFLMEDCCGGRPECCRAAIEGIVGVA